MDVEGFNIEKYNQELKNFQQKVYSDFKAEIAGLGIKGKQELLRRARTPAKISERNQQEGILKKDLKKGQLRKEDGEIVSIGFKFPRHGVFLAYGVRNRHPITDPKNAKDWWGASLNRNIPLLAKMITDAKAEYIIKAAVGNFNKTIQS